MYKETDAVYCPISVAVPPAVDLSSTKAGEWVTGFIKFEMELSNVMLVKAEFSPTVGSSKPSLSLQKDSLVC